MLKGKKSISETLIEKSEMKKVDTVKYLRDYISSDGSNTVNIAEREKKVVGINAQVISLVKEVSLGSHYFDIGLLYRDTKVINGILFNSEVWYGHSIP